MKLLVSYSGLFAMFANLGFNNVTTRFFPYFRDKEKKHHGFLFYSVMVSFIGFLLCAIFFYIFRDEFIARNIEKSKLLTDYLFYLLPLTFFTLYFAVFDVYARAVYSSVAGTFLKEFLQRVFIIIVILLYYFETINFQQLVFGYIAALSLPTVLLAFFLLREKEWGLFPNFSHVSSGMAKDMMSLSLFSILTGFSSFAISNVDAIMVNDMLGIEATGVYSIVFYFGTLIAIPSRSIYRISSSVISDAMKKSDMDIIYKVYHKSCITQLVMGAFIFLMIWCNIDNVLMLLPPEFAAGKYVILFIGVGNLFEMATGVNGIIVANSKYYRYDTLFMILLIGITIAANLIFIPPYGITGSAIASAIAIFTYNLIRFLFVLFAFKMQPLDMQTFKVIIVSGLAFAACYFIPYLGNFLVDGAVRAMIICIAFWLLIMKMKVSEDIYLSIQALLVKLGIKV